MLTPELQQDLASEQPDISFQLQAVGGGAELRTFSWPPQMRIC
jgi:hypothetical protein